MRRLLPALCLCWLAGCAPGPATSNDSSTEAAATTTAAMTTSSATETPTSGMTPCEPGCGGGGKILEGSFNVWPDDPAMFDCVSEIRGDLSFVSNGFNRSQFASLQRVTGTLSPAAGCTDFSHFSCLGSVGSLVLEHPQECVTDLNGLQGLSTIESMLRITDAPGLLSLDALEGLVNGPTRVELLRLPQLNALSLHLANQVENVELRDLPALDTVALNLPDHVDSIHLSLLPKLTDLTFLEPVTTVGALRLVGLHAVESLESLADLQTAERLEIGGCPGQGTSGMDALKDLSGLDSLTAVGVLTVVGNKSMTSLGGAPNLTSFDAADFVNNDSLPVEAIDAFLLQNTNPNAAICIDNQCDCP